jgi:hypothetical protein
VVKSIEGRVNFANRGSQQYEVGVYRSRIPLLRVYAEIFVSPSRLRIDVEAEDGGFHTKEQLEKG